MAAVASMTGFAHVQGEAFPGDGTDLRTPDRPRPGLPFVWEARSINGRNLEMKVRLPSGWEGLEPEVRRRTAERFARGTINVSLAVSEEVGSVRYRVNEPQLAYYLDAIGRLTRENDFVPPSADQVLMMRGVLEPVDETAGGPATRPEVREAVMDGLERMLAALADMRRGEGARLRAVIEGQLDDMAALAGRIADHQALLPETVKVRLVAQVSALLDAAPALAADRLHQEAAQIAARADIREELDRIAAHLAAVRALLEEGGAIGRRLDFLAQELNREANTICSKAGHPDITAAGVDLKARVDQMREQVQNIE